LSIDYHVLLASNYNIYDMLALRIDELRHWYIVKGFWAKTQEGGKEKASEKAERIPITWLLDFFPRLALQM
jgi:hypothetical protein